MISMPFLSTFHSITPFSVSELGILGQPVSPTGFAEISHSHRDLQTLQFPPQNTVSWEVGLLLLQHEDLCVSWGEQDHAQTDALRLWMRHCTYIPQWHTYHSGHWLWPIYYLKGHMHAHTSNIAAWHFWSISISIQTIAAYNLTAFDLAHS